MGKAKQFPASVRYGSNEEDRRPFVGESILNTVFFRRMNELDFKIRCERACVSDMFKETNSFDNSGPDTRKICSRFALLLSTL